MREKVIFTPVVLNNVVSGIEATEFIPENQNLFCLSKKRNAFRDANIIISNKLENAHN